jgi:MerR family transcriptional regulator, thiopeptide resistance regulator
MGPAVWKVGELARQTGLTVRTLRYYDEIGLLTPSHRTEAGYRLYTVHDIVRLQQIRSLRQLGFSLEEIQDWLDRPDFAPQRAIRLHIQRLQEQIELQRALCRRLEALNEWLNAAEEISAGELIQTIKGMTMYEKYYTEEQMAELKARAEQVGPERMRQVEAEWPALMAEVKTEMAQGTDPADPRVQALARRWMGLVKEFTGGNPGIAQSLNNMYQQEPGVREQAGVDMALFEYIGKAMAAAQQNE